MFRTKRAASAWAEREGVTVKQIAQPLQMPGSRFAAKHPDHPAIVCFGGTYLKAVNELMAGIDEERASDARARESEIPW